MADGRREIQYVKLSELAVADRNPKEHDQDGMRRSIGRFGFADAPVMDERTGRIVAGHGRALDLASRQGRGDAPPEGIELDDGGEWLIPVQRGWSSRSDAEAEAFLIAHNRLTEIGGWDRRLLAEVLEDLAAEDPELLLDAQYSEDDLHRLLAEIADREPPPEFPSYDSETIKTEHSCPRCGYKWSGGA